MSTTTPPTESGAEVETDTHIDGRPDRGTTGTGRPDRWAARTPSSRRGSRSAPLTFDPFCARRLRNCIDGENAAFVDPD